MEPGDVIIDGGNALYTDTIRREKALAERGLHFVGAGISGGEEGAQRTCHHARRPGRVVQVPGPVAGVGGRPCRRCAVLYPYRPRRQWTLRQDGAQRHRVRRHAAHRRGLRPAAAGPDLPTAEIAEVFARWNTGALESYLVEITAEVLAQVDAETGKPLVDVIVDEAGQKGTGRWTVKSALDLGIPTTGIAEAVFARALSSSTDQRKAAAGLSAGTPPPRPPTRTPSSTTSTPRCTRPRSSPTHRGFDQIAAGSKEYGWDVDPGALATIWRGGCIIRAQFSTASARPMRRTRSCRAVVGPVLPRGRRSRR